MPKKSIAQKIAGFRQDASRWQKSLDAMRGMTGTTFFGIMARACEELDGILMGAVMELLPIVGEQSKEKVKNVTGGKPVERLTLGQNAQILVTLKSEYRRCLGKRGEAARNLLLG